MNKGLGEMQPSLQILLFPSISEVAPLMGFPLGAGMKAGARVTQSERWTLSSQVCLCDSGQECGSVTGTERAKSAHSSQNPVVCC